VCGDANYHKQVLEGGQAAKLQRYKECEPEFRIAWARTRVRAHAMPGLCLRKLQPSMSFEFVGLNGPSGSLHLSLMWWGPDSLGNGSGARCALDEKLDEVLDL
jgi:hypothetical protein